MSLTPYSISLAKQQGFNNTYEISQDGKKDNLLTRLMSLSVETNLNLSEQEIDFLLVNSDLEHANFAGETPLILYLKQTQVLSLTPNQVSYLLEHSDLEKIDSMDKTALNYAIIFAQDGLNEKQFDYLLRNSQTKNKCTTHIPELCFFEYALMFQAKKNEDKKKLSFEQLDYLYENSPHKNKPFNYHNVYYTNLILNHQVAFLEEKIIQEDKKYLAQEILPIKIHKFRKTLVNKKQFKV